MAGLHRMADAALGALADDFERHHLAGSPARRLRARSLGSGGGKRAHAAQNLGMSGNASAPRCTCMRPSSAQRRSCGKTLPGLSRCCGSNAHLTRICWSRSILAEHLRHQIALFDADAMLAGEHAADLDAEPQDIGAEGLRLVQLARPVGIVEDQRMEIAVAGVEHIGDPQPVARGELAHAGQHPRQLLAGNGAVHAVVIRRDAADRREGRLAAGPEEQPLLLRLRHAADRRPVGGGNRHHPVDQVIDLLAAAVELDDQQRLAVERIAGMDERLGGLDRRSVHHLHAAGNDAGGDDLGHAASALLPRSQIRRAARARFRAASRCAPSPP